MTQFTQELFDEVCGYLATGESLRTVCKREGMPDKSNVFRWINANPELRDQYARAKADGCNALAEEMFDIADELPPLKDDGAIDQGHNTWAKNRVDVRKWYLSKIAPKIYGDRVDHTSSDGSMSPKAAVEMTDEQLEKLAMGANRAEE